MKKRVFNILKSLVLALAAFSALANSEKGLEIAQEAKRRDVGWSDSQADLKMILRNQQGKESTRELRIQSLEITDDGDKSLTVFDTPKDVQGTAFLSFSHATVADEQWLYLPALKRVKRIASRNKSGPFMGSEFAFEDMSSFEVEKYTYNYLRDEACPTETELTCFVIEQFPVDNFSGYTRRITWIDHQEYRMQKSEFYDRKNSLLKTLLAQVYQQYLNKYWRPGILEMENHQTGKSTQLTWMNYRFKTGLEEKAFNQNTLKRAR
jgi:Outer membrane lipoprotein-sorting protein